MNFDIFDSTRSNHIKQRIDSIELVEGVDYEVLLNVQQNPQGGRPTNHYTFTPKAFKLCFDVV